MDQELADVVRRFYDELPTGARVEYAGAGFFRISNGLIEEAWIVGDTQAFWEALRQPATNSR